MRLEEKSFSERCEFDFRIFENGTAFVAGVSGRKRHNILAAAACATLATIESEKSRGVTHY